MSECKCLVCSSQSISELLNTKVAHPLWWMNEYPDVTPLRYSICDNCGYIFLWPRFSIDEYRDIYSKTPGLDRDEISRARRKMLLSRKEFIDTTAQAKDKNAVLEVGPAYGDFLNLFSSYQRKIGVEPSETYVSQAAKEGSSIEYYPYMLESLLQAEPQLEAVADLVMACHVLEHTLDPVAFVAELSKLLKNDGELFIEVPSIEGMAEISSPLYQNLYFGHVSQFSVPVLTRIGIMCGLLPVKVEYKSTDDYPVIQALFKKAESPQAIADKFKQHAKSSRAALETGLAEFKSVLFDPEIKRILVWGCGQDLFDIVSLFDRDTTKIFCQKVNLVDRNEGKQGCEFGGIKITSPESVLSEQYDRVVVATRSEILNSAIINDCKRHFADVNLHKIFATGNTIAHA